MSELGGDSRYLLALTRLTPAELDAMRSRCGGRSSAEIAALMLVPPETARALLASIYDKLGITWQQETTSLAALSRFCPYVSQVSAPQPASPPEQPTQPLPPQPSERALLLVQEDDDALMAQRVPPTHEPAPGRRLTPFVAFGSLAVLAILVMIGLLVRGTDRSNPTPTPASGGAASTATPSPTPTPVPPTPAPTPTVTPTGAPTVAPTPMTGSLLYAANWSAGADNWQLGTGWTVAGASLASSSGAGSLAAPFTPTGPNFGIEAKITLLSGSDACPDGVGIFGRGTAGTPLTSGSSGITCQNAWAILASRRAGTPQDTVGHGTTKTDQAEHTYRLEIQGDPQRRFTDAVFVGETTNNRWTNAGIAGLVLSGDVQVKVSGFQIYQLP